MPASFYSRELPSGERPSFVPCKVCGNPLYLVLPHGKPANLQTRSGAPAIDALKMEPNANPLQLRYVSMGDVEVNQEAGTFEGYAVRFGELNGHREIFHPGCFKATLATPPRGRRASFYLHHDWNQIAGEWTEMREDDTGLFVRGRWLESHVGQHARELARLKLATGLSIGFTYEDYSVDNDDDWDKRITHHQAVNLYEVSQVEYPSDKTATITAARDIRADMTVREIETVLRGLPNMPRDAAKAMASMWKPKGAEERDAPDDQGDAELRDAAAREAETERQTREADAANRLLKALTG